MWYEIGLINCSITQLSSWFINCYHNIFQVVRQRISHLSVCISNIKLSQRNHSFPVSGRLTHFWFGCLARGKQFRSESAACMQRDSSDGSELFCESWDGTKNNTILYFAIVITFQQLVALVGGFCTVEIHWWWWMMIMTGMLPDKHQFAYASFVLQIQLSMKCVSYTFRQNIEKTKYWRQPMVC